MAQGPTEGDYVEIDARELTGVFAAPSWLRDVGLTSWLLVGVALFLVGMVWLASLTQTIVAPVITAAVVAAVASPLVAWMNRHRIPRPLAALLIMLGLIGVGVGLFLMVVGGITAESQDITSQISDARGTLQGWLEDVGIDPSTAAEANKNASSSISSAFSQLKDGLAHGISALSGLAFFLALTILSLFFLLSDGPKIRHWAEGHFGVPRPVAHIVSGRTLGALRGYFLGVTIVAGFNAAVVTLGALILGVPLIGTIAAVTFVGGFIPYLGAWTAAAFSVLLALGGAGPEAAGGMVIVQLLANGLLQQLVQPFAMGAALGIHPLAVLIVTIAGGALFGAAGLILSAPLVSAVVRISGDLSRSRDDEHYAEQSNPATEEEIADDDPSP
ncbi:MAG TPA: AI-2E family transporter [Solirubrobacterales bacterium]|nr:AI-2E family transporter [Solirubrobacterales bacterium]